MTTERAMRLAAKWSDGLVCSLREGEAAEYHKMFLDMLRVKQEAEQQGPCSRCGYGGQHLDAPPCTTCEVENSTPLTLDELREMDGEPVWVVVNTGIDPLSFWALVEVCEESIFLTNNLGGRTEYAADVEFEEDCITVYHCKP